MYRLSCVNLHNLMALQVNYPVVFFLCSAEKCGSSKCCMTSSEELKTLGVHFVAVIHDIIMFRFFQFLEFGRTRMMGGRFFFVSAVTMH